MYRSACGIENFSLISSMTTLRRNLIEFSSTSSHNDEISTASKSDASGKSCNASRASRRSSEQSSASSPERQARFRKANEKFSAARVPTRAKPNEPVSEGGLFAESSVLFWKCIKRYFFVSHDHDRPIHKTTNPFHPT